MKKVARILTIIGPGMLVAATGVGAGDLATGSFAGSLLGTAVLWAVIVGALLKFVITEGIARWQLATGSTILEGISRYLGPIAIWIFLPYLLLWSYFTGSALMSACGVTLYAIFPIFKNPVTGKIFFGILASLIGLILVYRGGYRLFEKVMGACIGIMFVTVVLTAVLLWPGYAEVLKGIFIPSIPDFKGTGLTWTVALIGGVGGTVTVLSYGYWIREEGRDRKEDLPVCRIDLVSGYVMTALFGLSVVIIGSQIDIEGSGATLLVRLSEQLGKLLGPAGKWLFLTGALGAVFSSLLGVWQATPYFFADAWILTRIRQRETSEEDLLAQVNTRSPVYRGYLFLLAFIPMLGLFSSFQEIQRIYAVTGAFFIPLLALALLILNGRAKWVGDDFKNPLPVTFCLVGTIIFFVWIAINSIFN